MLDEIDWKIVDRLCHNGRIPLTELSEGMELSRVAIANRIEKLMQSGLLHIGAALDLERLNYQTFLIELQIPEKRQAAFKKLLAGSPQILQCFETTGRFNWLLVCVDKSAKELREFVEGSLKKFAEDCHIILASNPHGPDFTFKKLAKLCKNGI